MKGRDERGSVFVETLIATAITATMLAAYFGALGETATRNREAGERRLALLVARSQLTAAAVARQDQDVLTGLQDGLVWTTTVRPWAEAEDARDLRQVTVTVRRDGDTPVLARLSTLRVEQAREALP